MRKLVEFAQRRWKFHRLLAYFWSKNNLWVGRAVVQWKKASGFKNARLTSKDYLNYANALQHIKKSDDAIKVLSKALKKYPTHKELIIKLTGLYKAKKSWKKASDTLIKLFEQENSTIKEKYYNDLVQLYINQQLYHRASYIIKLGLERYPNNSELIKKSVEIPILNKNWDHAITTCEHILEKQQENTHADILYYLAMLLQIKGNHEKAQHIFTKVLDEQKDSEHRVNYRKIILFDNGESRIEFYKNFKKTEQIVVTFDSINMNWNQSPFGFKAIMEHGADIVAVRKRKKRESQQHLTQEEFVDTVAPLVAGYREKLSYGHSLGGYTALYFASLLDCHILALAPRLSIHPIYGKKEPNQQLFQHQLSHKYNDKISPIIVYDPKDKLDSAYINDELLVAFPKAQLVEIHYGGHSLARHLLRMGVLKDYLITFLEGGVPQYDRKLKSKSANYHRILGRECLRRGKLKWASSLSERAVELLPTDRYVVKFRIDVLKKLNKLDEAIEFAKSSVKLAPRNRHIHLMLIDLYIEQGSLIYAERELKLALEKFKATTQLINRAEKIEEKLSSYITS